MDEQDILEEIKSLVERASVFSDATVTYADHLEGYDGPRIIIDLPREGRFLLEVRPI